MQNKSFSKNILHGIRLRFGKIFHNPYQIVNIGPIKKIYYKHLNAGKVRSHKLFGNDFFFISPRELMHGLNEIFIEEVYKQNLPPNPFIIDCGANIGLSVIYLKEKFPDAEIIAFEPDDKNFELLESNMKSFKFKNVQLNKEAIWIENTTLQFANEGSMSSRINEQPVGNTVSVKAVRLKDYLDKAIDFLKIDIEGAEFRVIMDIEEKLTSVRNMFLEYHGSFDQNNELNQILSLLTHKGFSYYIKEATSVFDHPFIRQNKSKIQYDVQLNIFCFRMNVPS